jgi:hypothetical protein
MRLFPASVLCAALCACVERRPASGAPSTPPDSAGPALALADYRLAGGAVRFRAPAHWHVVRAPTSGDDFAAVFHVRSAAVDSGTDRTNVLVSVLHGPAATPFRAATDGVLAMLLEGPVLGDTLLGRAGDAADPERRFIFWRGQEGATAYALYDDFGRRDTLMVHVRAAVPISAMASAAWADSLEAGTRRLLASVTLGGVPLFPGWAGHPNLSTWSP